jgi:hypothetical protein
MRCAPPIWLSTGYFGWSGFPPPASDHRDRSRRGGVVGLAVTVLIPSGQPRPAAVRAEVPDAVSPSRKSVPPAGQPLPRRPMARRPPRAGIHVRSSSPSRRAAKEHLDVADKDRADNRPDARHAGAGGSGRKPDRRAVRTLRARAPVGVRRSHQLEVLRSILPVTAELPRGAGL